MAIELDSAFRKGHSEHNWIFSVNLIFKSFLTGIFMKTYQGINIEGISHTVPEFDVTSVFFLDWRSQKIAFAIVDDRTALSQLFSCHKFPD